MGCAVSLNEHLMTLMSYFYMPYTIWELPLMFLLGGNGAVIVAFVQTKWYVGA